MNLEVDDGDTHYKGHPYLDTDLIEIWVVEALLDLEGLDNEDEEDPGGFLGLPAGNLPKTLYIMVDVEESIAEYDDGNNVLLWSLPESPDLVFTEVRKINPEPGESPFIHFFPDGCAEPAVIVLRASDGEERILEIQPLAALPVIRK